MSEELKPCPFCGGTTLKRVMDEHNGELVVDQIWCTRCGTKGPNEAYEYYGWDWNTRTPAWQDISTAPKDGTRFWAYEKGAGPDCYECWWQNDFGHWEGWQTDWDNEPDPTHWMPLEPPVAKIKGE